MLSHNIATLYTQYTNPVNQTFANNHSVISNKFRVLLITNVPSPEKIAYILPTPGSHGLI